METCGWSQGASDLSCLVLKGRLDFLTSNEKKNGLRDFTSPMLSQLGGISVHLAYVILTILIALEII